MKHFLVLVEGLCTFSAVWDFEPTASLSVSDHIRGVLSNCSQTLYGIRVLRSHGLCEAGLQTVFQSVIMAKLLYASSAWSGFATAADRQRVNAFLAEASDGVSIARTHPRSRYCWRTVINSCFARSWTIRNTFYIVCYRHPHQLHNTIRTSTADTQQRTARPYWPPNWLKLFNTNVILTPTHM